MKKQMSSIASRQVNGEEYIEFNQGGEGQEANVHQQACDSNFPVQSRNIKFDKDKLLRNAYDLSAFPL